MYTLHKHVLGPLLDVLNDNQTHLPSQIIIIIIRMNIQLFILVIIIISDNFHYIPILLFFNETVV